MDWGYALGVINLASFVFVVGISPNRGHGIENIPWYFYAGMGAFILSAIGLGFNEVFFQVP